MLVYETVKTSEVEMAEKTAENLLAEAEKYERLAKEMQLIGDKNAEHSFRQMAESYLEDAVEVEAS